MNLHKNSCEVSPTISKENSEKSVVVIWSEDTKVYLFSLSGCGEPYLDSPLQQGSFLLGSS